MIIDKKDVKSAAKATLWITLVIIIVCSLGCKTNGVERVYVPVSEDTYIRQRQIEAARQRDANEYRESVMDSYSRERSEIRRIQADIERDKRRYEAQAEEDRRDAAKDIFENFQDRRADAARDYRDAGRDIAPYVYKDLRRVLKRR